MQLIQGATANNPGTITLRGNKVTFANTTGTQSGKIYIDPNTGTLHAVDGDFSGTINATNSTFSGTVTATDGTFNGIVKAKTMYSDAYNIPNGVTSITIGTYDSGKIYTQYLRQGGTNDINIYLPDPESYPGLEIGFLFFTTADLNITNATELQALKSIIINKPTGGYYLRAKKASFIPAIYNPSTAANGISEGWKSNQAFPAQYTQILLDTIIPPMKGVSWIKIAPNTLTRFKSISGRWYQIEGNNIDGSDSYTPN